jgi:large repetitive protein
MSPQHKPHRSMFGRLQELFFGNRSTKPRQRKLRLESLETRRVLAAELGQIVGNVFRDLDNDGSRDAAEVGFAGLTVQLFRDTGNGSFEAAVDTLVSTDTTDANGAYNFNDLATSTYFVRRPAQTPTSGPYAGKKFTAATSGPIYPSALKTVIDSFDAPASQTAAVDTSNDNIPGTSLASGLPTSHTIGGEREIITNFTGSSAGPGILMSARVATITVNQGPMGLLLLDATSSGKGVYTLVWDGTDGSASSSPNTTTGLGGIDLTKGGADQLRIKLNSLDLPGATVRATVYSDATHYSTASLPLLARVIDGVASDGGATDYVFRFNGTGTGGFAVGTGATGNANFQSVKAVTLTIDAQANDIDARLETFGAYGSAISTVNLPIDEVDVSITKTANTLTPIVGGLVTFNITVSNATNLPGGRAVIQATGVQVKDDLFTDPANQNKLTYVSDTSGGAFNATTGIWTVGNLNPGQSKSFQVRMRVNPSALPKATNVVRVTSVEQVDIDTDDWVASREITPKFIDVGLSKVVSNSKPDMNANVQFTLTAKNNGTAGATNVTVEDLLTTADLSSFETVTITPATGTTYDSGTGIWTIPALGPGQSLNLIVAGKVIDCEPFTNRATLKSIGNGTDTNANNNTTSVTATPKEVDIGIVKQVVGNSTFSPTNNTITYRLTVSNTGPDNATGVIVSDSLPSSLEFVSASNSTYDATTGRWNVGALANGATKTLTITARLATATPPSSITNTATVIALNQCDDNTANDTSTVTVSNQVIDLSVTKKVDRANPTVGENVLWTMTVKNDGPNTATNVSLKDVLPAGVSFVSSSAAKGSFNAATGIWTVGSLIPTEIVALTITSRVNTTSPQLNMIEVYTADQIDIDSTPNNNADEDDKATAGIVGVNPVIDLSVTKKVDRSSVTIGENVLWTMTVKNDGPNTATNVSLKDVLPSGVSYVSSSVAKGSFDVASGVWTVGSLIPTEIVALTITTRVNSSTQQVNAIEVFTANETDIDSTPNNGAVEDDRATAAVTAVNPKIDLAVSKTVDRTVPTVGETVLFTMIVSNTGPTTATGVSLLDRLPTGLTYVSSSVAKGTYSVATGIWNVGTLVTNERVALTITARVDAPVPLTNVIEVYAADQEDIDSTPNNGLLEDDRASAGIFPIGPTPQGDPDPPTFSKRQFMAR